MIHISDFKKISARFNEITFSQESPQGLKTFSLKYKENKELQKKISEFITSFVNQYPDIFSSYCSQCGNCCKRKNISVSGGELFPAATNLNMTEEEFYSSYINVSETWSEYDGCIKTDEDKCPFLEKKSSGRYECKIYEYRPYDCISFSPDSELCEKSSFDLIEQIESVEIENGMARVSLRKSGKIYEKELTQSLTKKLSEVMTVIFTINPEETERKIKEILEKSEGIMKYLEQKKTPVNEFREFITLLKKTLTNMADKEGIYEEEVKNLRQRISNLEKDYENPPQSEITEKTGKTVENFDNLISAGGFMIKEIAFYPSYIELKYNHEGKDTECSINYKGKRELLNSVRNFLRGITVFLKNTFPSILENIVEKCYVCGKCCFSFTIDINPSDIRRLADKFNMTEENFRKEYIISVTGTWNQGNGIIKKTDKKECVFLKKGNLDFSYCSVHEIKPDVCRDYKPGKRGCYLAIDDKNYYRLISNILDISINNSTININTSYTSSNLPHPLILNWHEYPELKDKIEVVLSELKEILPVVINLDINN